MNFYLSHLNKGLFKYDLTPKGGEESDGKSYLTLFTPVNRIKIKIQRKIMCFPYSKVINHELIIML